MDKTEIIRRLKELDKQMAVVPWGQGNAEYDTLEIEHERLLAQLGDKEKK